MVDRKHFRCSKTFRIVEMEEFFKQQRGEEGEEEVVAGGIIA